jgi:hypothetical protein
MLQASTFTFKSYGALAVSIAEPGRDLLSDQQRTASARPASAVHPGCLPISGFSLWPTPALL